MKKILKFIQEIISKNFLLLYILTANPSRFYTLYMETYVNKFIVFYNKLNLIIEKIKAKFSTVFTFIKILYKLVSPHFNVFSIIWRIILYLNTLILGGIIIYINPNTNELFYNWFQSINFDIKTLIKWF